MRKGVRVVGTAEFFFFNRGKDVVVIEEGDGYAWAWSSDAEDVLCLGVPSHADCGRFIR